MMFISTCYLKQNLNILNCKIDLEFIKNGNSDFSRNKISPIIFEVFFVWLIDLFNMV